MNVIGILLIAFCAIFGALRPKSVFSLRSVASRKLVFTPDELVWGNLIMPIQEIENLELYIYAFDTFKYPTGRISGRVVFTREYGDRNKISFSYRGAHYDLTCFLGNFTHYDTLVNIVMGWRERGIHCAYRSAFTDSYFREQVKRYG